jgi:hypothetical protein
LASLLVRFVPLLAYLALLYGSIPFTRAVVLSLNAANLTGLVVTLVFMGAAAGGLGLLVFRYRLKDPAAYALLVVAATTVAYFAWGLDVPEERVHFIQFGLLSMVAAWTFAPRLAGVALYGVAFAVSAAAGVVDEAIQGIVPDRVFDWSDIGLDVTAAALGVALLWLIRSRLLEASDVDEEYAPGEGW